MTTLKIPEVILRERRRKNLTQEELAAALSVSPQAISNWERGGYPDIVMLPRVANFFGITVDELIGNDEVAREDDIEDFRNRYWNIGSAKAGCAEKIALAKEYYRKYPQNYDIMWHLGLAIIGDLGIAITGNMEDIEENRALLREIYQKILDGCTYEPYRRDASDWMCYAASDEDIDDWIPRTGRDWSSDAVSIGLLREDRFRLQERWDEFRAQRSKNDLLLLMQYLGRNDMDYYEHDKDRKREIFAEPERTVAWESHKIKLLDNIDDNGLPDAWLGCYAESHLKLAGALVGCGRVDEGFDILDKTFALYEKWNAVPDKGELSFGTGIYGDAKTPKGGDGYIYYADASLSWTPCGWLFWQLKNDIYVALRSWIWFDGVKNDERYLAAFERAKAMAEIKE